MSEPHGADPEEIEPPEVVAHDNANEEQPCGGYTQCGMFQKEE